MVAASRAAASREGWLPRLAASRRAELGVAAALLSAGAAAIHSSVAGPHLQEYALFGVLFAASALAQAVWAALVLAAPSRRLLAVGLVGNAVIIAIWALSRTVGLPLGPEPWTPELAAPLDVLATAFELGIVVANGALLATARASATASGRRVSGFAAIGSAAVAAAVFAAFAGTPGEEHDEAGPTGSAGSAPRTRSNGVSPAPAHAHVTPAPGDATPSVR